MKNVIKSSNGGTINLAKPFLNFIDVISIKVQNSMLDLNLFCNKAYRNLNFIGIVYKFRNKYMLAMNLALNFVKSFFDT